jgi:hypothetical protein
LLLVLVGAVVLLVSTADGGDGRGGHGDSGFRTLLAETRRYSQVLAVMLGELRHRCGGREAAFMDETTCNRSGAQGWQPCPWVSQQLVILTGNWLVTIQGEPSPCVSSSEAGLGRKRAQLICRRAQFTVLLRGNFFFVWETEYEGKQKKDDRRQRGEDKSNFTFSVSHSLGRGLSL